MFFFFFSSRRRHTRWNCDWSSDVCSSDLEEHEQDRADLAPAEALGSPVARTGDRLLLLLEAREERRLAETDADEERDHHEDGADPEGIAPALRREIRGGHRVA